MYCRYVPTYLYLHMLIEIPTWLGRNDGDYFAKYRCFYIFTLLVSFNIFR